MAVDPLVQRRRNEGSDLLYEMDFVDRPSEFVGELGHARPSFWMCLSQEFVCAFQPEHVVIHVYWKTYRRSAIGERPRDRLPDPPCRIGGKLVPERMIVLVRRAHQSHHPLLEEIIQAEIGKSDIRLRDVEHEPEIRHDHRLLRIPTSFDYPVVLLRSGNAFLELT